MANQWMPYAENARAAMYSGGDAVKTPSHVRPTKRITPLSSWQNPGIQMPQTPRLRSTPSSLGGQFASSCGA